MIKYITIFLVNFLDKYIHQRKLKKVFLNINYEIKNVMDIGCHEGDYSVLLRKVFKNSYIHAFEPNILLKSKIKRKNILKNKFKINYMAVSDIDGNIDMIIDNEISKISTGSKINYNSKTYKVKEILYSSNKNKDLKNRKKIKSIKIDTYIEKYNLKFDFVKIDVEGFELKVLTGFKKNISRTKFIMIEYHKDNLYEGFNSENVDSFLKQNDFELISSLKFPFMNWEDRLYQNKNLKFYNT